jgi:uncharacterized lipoprotein YmbA
MRTKSFLTGVMLAAGLLMGCGGTEPESTPDEEREQNKALAETLAAIQAESEGFSSVNVQVGAFDGCYICVCHGGRCACERILCAASRPTE